MPESVEAHAHYWLVDLPKPGVIRVDGRCACGAERSFIGRYVEESWQIESDRRVAKAQAKV